MKRLAAVVTGTMLVVGGFYIVVGERLVGTSTDATINAHVVTLRAPIDGTLSFSIRNIGARVEEGGEVAEIYNSRYDTARLRDLERQQAEQSTEQELVAARIAAISETRAVLDLQSNAYKTGRIRQLDAKLADAKAVQQAALARQREADSALLRTSGLAGRGLQTVIMLDRAQSMHDVAEADIDSAKQKLDYLQIELAAASTGVFLGDSYNDAPVSTQRIHELDLRLAELKGEQQRIQAQRELSKDHVSAERLQINKSTSAVLRAPAQSIAWTFLADRGDYVGRGQELVRLVDCSTIIVTASVAESLYNTLTLGSVAQLRLFGDNRAFHARVVRLGGTSATNLYTELAVAPGQEHLKRFDVALTAPALAEYPDLECAVGRTGRLVFASGPLALLFHGLTRLGW